MEYGEIQQILLIDRLLVSADDWDLVIRGVYAVPLRPRREIHVIVKRTACWSGQYNYRDSSAISHHKSMSYFTGRSP